MKTGVENLKKKLELFQYNPFIFRIIALREIVKLFSIKGYCTVLQLNRWFEDKGKVYNFYHTGKPNRILRKLWEIHITRGNSKIEKYLYQIRDDKLGFKVFKYNELAGNIIGRLMLKANLSEMGYLWMSVDENDLLCFCLRKKPDETAFTSEETAALLEIGELIYENRTAWHDEFAITNEEKMLCYDLMCQHLTVKQIAERLKIKENAVTKRREEIIENLDVVYPTLTEELDYPKNLEKILTPKNWKNLNTMIRFPFQSQIKIAERLDESEEGFRKNLQRINDKLKTENHTESFIKILEFMDHEVSLK